MHLTYKSMLSLTLLSSFFSINHLPLNPVYLLSLVIIFVYVIVIAKYQTFKVSKYECVTLLFIALLTITQILGLKITYSRFRELNVLASPLFLYSIFLGAITYNFANKSNNIVRNQVYEKNLKYLVSFLVIESLTRFTFMKSNKAGLYAFKKSFFYFDSNFVALVILNFLFFFYYLETRKSFNFTAKYKAILWILLFLTFSRAAIATGLILYFILLKSGKLRFVAVTFSVLLGAYQLTTMINYYLSGGSFLEVDGSFNSKFYIIKIFMDFYSQLNIYEKLMGIGMGNLDLYLDIFAHNILVTFLAELGLLGTLILCIYFIYTLTKTNKYSYFILLPTFIAGLSLFSAYSPFVFALIALIVVEENHKRVSLN